LTKLCDPAHRGCRANRALPIDPKALRGVRIPPPNEINAAIARSHSPTRERGGITCSAWFSNVVERLLLENLRRAMLSGTRPNNLAVEMSDAHR